ncbi:MAG TPA: ROK family glucokinase [Nocardioides sp.]|jgi:glucokinase|uniref:ROK family glucokinase n=1 Tax=Nocardioides sp. TaxID=35761 RepID=UPI002E3667DA|nr:ROK family glucokinase [Nocardioides sp.]HEX3932611.1 ROK family glucokinase [Nocardioides sp.]
MSETRPRRARSPRWEPLTVGIDIGGTKVLGAVVDAAGTVVAVERRPTEGHDVTAVEDTIVDLVAGFSASYDVAAVGIGAAGFVDVTRTVVMFSPHLDWRREPLRARVAERVRLPVVVDNDANTMALAECRFGAGRGHRFVLCVTLGTGIGGALVLDNRVYRGANGMAGEFGHMQVVPDGRRCECGNRGCWEQYASGNALVREARELVRSTSPMARLLRTGVAGDADRLDGPQITEAARGGDPLSTELFGDVGRWLGVGLAGMTAAFDPGCIIVGGGLSDAGDLLLEPTRQAFSRSLTGRGHREEPVIVRAELGPSAGFIGAADMARSAARRSRRGRLRRTSASRPRRRLFERPGVDGSSR